MHSNGQLKRKSDITDTSRDGKMMKALPSCSRESISTAELALLQLGWISPLTCSVQSTIALGIKRNQQVIYNINMANQFQGAKCFKDQSPFLSWLRSHYDPGHLFLWKILYLPYVSLCWLLYRFFALWSISLNHMLMKLWASHLQP